jgi:type II secretory pathway pseudopilin PulG
MIELIFVIVIIGILAAVAIPKLAATRDDAKISESIANARTVLGDFSSFYTSQGATTWADSGTFISAASNVNLLTSACAAQDNTATPITAAGGSTFALCDGTAQCLTFFTEPEGNLTIAAGSGDTPVCNGVKTDKAIVSLLKEHAFGGRSVSRD